MKKTLLLIIIFLLSFAENTYSQEYHPFLNNSSWILRDWVSCCRPPQSKVINEGIDIIIGPYTYKEFEDPFPSYVSGFGVMYTVYIREDVAERKVYKNVNNVDELLYDFSLDIGGTATLEGYVFTVTAVENIDVNGQTRKKMTLERNELYFGHTLTQVWIEGVGSPAHPFDPGCNMGNVMSSSGGTVISTKCSFQNGTHVYGNADNCSSELGIEENLPTNQSISFSPNPFTTELAIESASDFQDATVEMYNVAGQLVRQNLHQSGNKLKLNRDNLSSGLYFIRVLEKGLTITTSKIMID